MNSDDRTRRRFAWTGIAMMVALLAAPAVPAKDDAKDKKSGKDTPEQVVQAVKKDLKRASKAIDHSVAQANKEVRRVLKGKQ